MLSNESIFAAWQPVHAEYGIPWFPVASHGTKKPLISGYEDLDLGGSGELIKAAGCATAFGMCSTRKYRPLVVVSERAVRS